VTLQSIRLHHVDVWFYTLRLAFHFAAYRQHSRSHPAHASNVVEVELENNATPAHSMPNPIIMSTAKNFLFIRKASTRIVCNI